ncbi:MAG TPA: hypothetical protein VIV63_09815 [Steroidobacteraceae bacterium]
MKTSPVRPVLTAVWCGICLAACSKPEAASSPTATTQGPTSDPCALTSDNEVRKVFADAKAGVRDHSLDKYDIATCTWDTPANTFVVQLFTAHGSAEDEVRSRISGSVDPVKPGAGANIRYDSLAGIGDSAVVAAEKADDQQGILADAAVLGIRRGERMVVLFSRSLIDGDRAATVKGLEALGRDAATRL